MVGQLVCLVGDTSVGRGGHEPEGLRGKVEGVVQQDAGFDETQSASAVFHRCQIAAWQLIHRYGMSAILDTGADPRHRQPCRWDGHVDHHHVVASGLGALKVVELGAFFVAKHRFRRE